MTDVNFQYPIFGPEIKCPHCRQTIEALTLTDTYLCPRHGAFEADPNTKVLVHLQSDRHWRLWEDKWYRQHTHPDGIRFEIHEALDRLYTEGYRAIKVTIAERYYSLISSYLEKSNNWQGDQPESKIYKLYGLPVEFSGKSSDEPCWEIVNFILEKEKGAPSRYPYFRLFE
ncbi:TIGR02652 family protein [Geminocystis sp. GBBB08]|uniref:TIGR02652 family protein n=1 Tax=Geminocystis sp. GBBB08 TaxID=2604140 RepID=UPI0027E2C1DE|nr:TIGR02652 family protein [Geminocystis sp. GBBB08]MBL1210243.1 TIGR02652 family protein [Geminocystis sp. GBBB08]